MPDTQSAVISKLLADPSATEARAWLFRQDGVVRTLGESDDHAEAVALVERFYAAGAVAVVASEIDRYEREDLEGRTAHENTGHLVIELPAEPRARAAVLRIAGEMAMRLGFDPTPERGQHHVYCALD